MKHNSRNLKMKKLFSPWMLILCVFGVVINLILSKLIIFFNLPLYIDTVGTIIVSALGGMMPGMAVGFLSNIIGSISEPISMYYAILSIIIAMFSTYFSKRNMFKTWKGWLIASGVFILIGGGVGSVMTWLLYGGGIGGIAEPYAQALHAHGFSEFCAQLTMDIIIDIPDKLVSVFISCMVLKFCPESLKDKFPLGHIYDKSGTDETDIDSDSSLIYKKSVNQKMTFFVGAAVIIVSVLSLAIGVYYHQLQMLEESNAIAHSVSNEVALCVNGDNIDNYLRYEKYAEGYIGTKTKLYDILSKSPNVKRLYVYSVQRDGCYVVYDLDTVTGLGQPTGTRVEDDTEINKRIEQFLRGSKVESDYSKHKYGTLVSAYTPIRNSHDATVAYACTDIDMTAFINSLLTYIIQVMSLLFAISLLTIFVTSWYVNRNVTEPIRMIVDQTQALNRISPENWLTSEAWKNRVPVCTHDELEELYNTIMNVDENASVNVKKQIEAEQKLLQTKEIERINKELKLTIQEVKEANQSKTDFLSRMSHDIRTPLNAIIGTAILAKDELSNPSALSEYLNIITSSGHFLLGLINDILDINKIESGNLELRPEPYSVTDFISSVNSTIRPLAEKKNIDFVFEMGCGHGAILVDKLRYKQIFFNLLSNAIKYTPEGGKVEFIAEALSAPEGIAGVRNIVRDNGIGMAKDYLQHLYEPFTRDDNVAINHTEGSGLGLAIVKSIVDAMGGKISVNSEPGKGTEFIVDLYLPIASVDNHTENSLNNDMENVLTGRHILLVEDNEINTKIATKLLEKKNVTVITAVNGQDAVDKFNNSDDKEIDLILMDIRMPVMGGLAAAEKIRSLPRADAKIVPIVAMTANAYEEDVKQSINAGMNAHLTKPIEPFKLYETITKLIKKTGTDDV